CKLHSIDNRHRDTPRQQIGFSGWECEVQVGSKLPRSTPEPPCLPVKDPVCLKDKTDRTHTQVWTSPITVWSCDSERDLLAENVDSAENKEGSKKLPYTPAPGNPSNPESIAPGYGGPLKDVPAETFNSTAIPKSYHSPWEQAIINDPNLAETLNIRMPVPEPRPEAPEYKSFNRVATPFGGFDKAPQSSGITFKLPEIDLNLPNYSDLQDPGVKRPTFNRVAQGWITDGIPLILPTVPLEPMPIPESDDL
uniref:Myozenin 2b n=1 Tax=Oncorhynchus kisutch TaxID=8019 RepID=A0A8C7JEK2_ONCKI